MSAPTTAIRLAACKSSAVYESTSQLIGRVATLAGVQAALTEPKWRTTFALGENAVVVLLSAEGHTR